MFLFFVLNTWFQSIWGFFSEEIFSQSRLVSTYLYWRMTKDQIKLVTDWEITWANNDLFNCDQSTLSWRPWINFLHFSPLLQSNHIYCNSRHGSPFVVFSFALRKNKTRKQNIPQAWQFFFLQKYAHTAIKDENQNQTIIV